MAQLEICLFFWLWSAFVGLVWCSSPPLSILSKSLYIAVSTTTYVIYNLCHVLWSLSPYLLASLYCTFQNGCYYSLMPECVTYQSVPAPFLLEYKLFNSFSAFKTSSNGFFSTQIIFNSSLKHHIPKASFLRQRWVGERQEAVVRRSGLIFFILIWI